MQQFIRVWKYGCLQKGVELSILNAIVNDPHKLCSPLELFTTSILRALIYSKIRPNENSVFPNNMIPNLFIPNSTNYTRFENYQFNFHPNVAFGYLIILDIVDQKSIIIWTLCNQFTNSQIYQYLMYRS